MADKNLIERVKAGKSAGQSSNPNLVRLSKADHFLSPDANEALTELSDDEIDAFAVLEAVDELIKNSGCPEGIGEVLLMIRRKKSMRRSLGRAGIREYIEIVKETSLNILNNQQPLTVEAAAPGKSWWQFWKKG